MFNNPAQVEKQGLMARSVEPNQSVELNPFRGKVVTSFAHPRLEKCNLRIKEVTHLSNTKVIID